MRIMLAGGGTGGHVYPGLAVADRLRTAQLLWVGSVGGMERELVERAGLAFEGVHGGGLHGVGPRQQVVNGLQLVRGFFEALALVRRFGPHALFVTGGFASVPVAMACALWRVPSLVYLPDVEPGQAIRFLGRLAARVAVSTQDSRAFFPARKVLVTGYPVRPAFAGVTRAGGRAALGLGTGPVLLVVGGSRGARSLNDAVLAHLAELVAVCEVVHVAGTLDWARVSTAREVLTREARARYHPFEYLHEMGAALAAADLAVARAGASTLGELPYFGLPAILVPYPYAWRYQRVNADYLAAHGAALRVDDAELSARLVPLVRELLGAPERLAEMRRRARALAMPDAAQALAHALVELAAA